MKHIRLTRMTLLVLLIIAVLLTVGVVAAQVLYDLDRWTIDGGGGTSQGGTFTLSGAIGQPDAAISQGGNFHLAGGFWAGGGKVVYQIMLPITLR